MQIIKCQKAISKTNSDKCKLLEYSFNDKDIDLGVATITGRYPEAGFSMNTKSKELVYVILFDINELYYRDTNYCIVASCSIPAWDINQYKILQ